MEIKRFEWFSPMDKYVITQTWGVFHPEYPESFGFKKHNGLDFADPYGAKTFEIRAPFDCIVHQTKNQMNGGGFVMSIVSKNLYTFDDGKTSRVFWDFLHLDHFVAELGKEYKVGDLLAIGDNTGYSTGPHCHFQARRVDYDGIQVYTIDTNDANNSFDQLPYMAKPTALQYSEISKSLERIKITIAKLIEAFSHWKKL